MSTTPLATGEIVAAYPSGRQLSFRGELYFGRLDSTSECIPFVVHGSCADVLDPRAIIKVNNKVVYHPRAYSAHLEAWVNKWLIANPGWAEVKSITTDAAGAWPKGTRVRKRTFEKGDSHQVGALATVEGSEMLPDGRYLYSLHWDDMPQTSVICQAYKIEPVAAVPS